MGRNFKVGNRGKALFMKTTGDYIDNYRILKHQFSSTLYERYIVEQTSDRDKFYVLQKWKAVCFTSSQGHAAFLTQMNTLKNLHDPLILPVEDFGSDADDHPYLVLPYEMTQMDTVADRLRSGTLTEEECENILVDTGAALARAHQHNIIHGYLSPESILLAPQGEVLVTTFLSPGQGISIDRASLPFQYRFPESKVNRLSDQYALAGLVQDLWLEQGEMPEDAPILLQAIARAQYQDPTQRFKRIRDFLKEIGISLHLPERDTELEPMQRNVASSYAGKQPGAKSNPQPRSTLLNNQRRRTSVFTNIDGDRLRFWISFIGIGILTIVTLIALIHYLGSYQYTAKNDDQLEIAASRGENIVINIPMDGSINSLWASDQGLQLKLDEWKQPLEVVPPTPKSWGDTISTELISGGNKHFTLNGSLTLPSTLNGPEVRELHGLIIGHILYPTESGMVGFENKDTSISIPVHIHVISEAMRQSSSGENTFWELAALEGVLIAGFLLASKIAQYQWAPAILARIVGETEENRAACRKGLIRGIVLVGILAGVVLVLQSMDIEAPSSSDIAYIILFIGVSGIIILLRYIFSKIFRR